MDFSKFNGARECNFAHGCVCCFVDGRAYMDRVRTESWKSPGNLSGAPKSPGNQSKSPENRKILLFIVKCDILIVLKCVKPLFFRSRLRRPHM